MTNRLRAYVFLFVSAILWGAAGPVIKFTLQGIDPFPFLSYRLAVSALVGLILILVIKPKLKFKTRDYFSLILYSLLAVTFGLGFLFLGLDKTSALEAGLIGAIGPLAVIAGSAMFLKERVTRHERLGILIAFAGTIFTVISPVFSGGNSLKTSGNMLLALFLASDVAAVIIAKTLLKRKMDPMFMTSFAFIIGAITIVPYTTSLYSLHELKEIITMLPFKYHLGVWYMAIASGTIAYFVFMKGVKLIEASEAILFSYLQPIFSVPLAVLWLGEEVTVTFLVGAVIVAAGVYIAEKKKH